ncbi:uncharacterized protein [Littorina saxatilis]|uniref:Uncharacterized protein n=1 Tax=Littorina saxatilis TaxID=31220 RepID=A0AAN9BK81_9CAEN
MAPLVIVLIVCVLPSRLPMAVADAPKMHHTSQTVDNPELTHSGLDISLTASPVPQTFQYYYVGNNTVAAGARTVPDNKFHTSCGGHGDLVVCSVRPVTNTRFQTGRYLLGISNKHGGYLFVFEIKHEELHPEEDQGTVKGGQLVGLTLVALLLLAAVTYVCVFVFRHQKQPE